jgi:hypothetical protein
VCGSVDGLLNSGLGGASEGFSDSLNTAIIKMQVTTLINYLLGELKQNVFRRKYRLVLLLIILTY